MTRLKRAAGAAAAMTVALTAAIPGAAMAAAGPGTYPFYDCVGPAGTPSSFKATKENLPDAAAHGASAGLSYLLTDGSAVFVVQQFGDTTIAPGIPGSNLNVTCQVDLPNGSFTFTGFLVPRGA
jgi:hypothetical protein